MATELPTHRVVQRVQTGVRMERRILLVLKALAGSYGITLGDLLEGIVLHAFEGRAPFGAESRKRIADLRRVYGLDLRAVDSHLLVEGKKTVLSRRRQPYSPRRS